MTQFDKGWYEKYMKQRENAENNAADSLRELATRLKPFGVKTLTANYNGYGDSGDFESIDVTPENLNLPDILGAINTTEDSLKDLLWPLLPGGWEINEGSYGEIVLDIDTGKIRRTHNERIQEINTTEDEL